MRLVLSINIKETVVSFVEKHKVKFQEKRQILNSVLASSKSAFNNSVLLIDSLKTKFAC